MIVELFSPYPKQLEVLNALDNPQYKIVTLVTGRQVGKTTLAMNYAIKVALENREVIVMFVEPSEQQSLRVYKDCYKALEHTNLIKRAVGSKGVIEIELITGSKILFKSSLSENSLRGNSVHYLIVDECAYVTEQIFNEILLPCTAVTGRKIFLCSTPKGTKNLLYKYYNKGRNGNSKSQISFKFTYKSNPYANLELIELFKENLTEQQWKQEFEAEFVSGGAVFKNINDICVGKNITPSEFQNLGTVRNPYRGCCIGIDVGLRNDRTVISVIDIKSQKQIALISKKKVTASHIKEVIKDAIEFYKPVKAYIETNGMGLPIYQDLKEIDSIKNVLMPFTTTNSNKQELVSQLVYMCDKKSITLIDNDDLRIELENFGFEFLPSGKVKYAAANNKSDDFIMATLISIAARNEQKNSGKYLIK